MDYSDFFSLSTDSVLTPYPFQHELAEKSYPDVLQVGTGAGKTAAIVLSWLYKRLKGLPDTPRRLIYCLPMRVLVEQTLNQTNRWIKALKAKGIYTDDNVPMVFGLMGGHLDKDWDSYPDKDVIVIGTQDQLLSRVLNRGYGTSRFRWPVHFGLLNNDCLWVYDEIQLMGSGLFTSTQMQAFRNMLGTLQPVKSIWMSATINMDWLRTVDFKSEVDSLIAHRLSEEDLAVETLGTRMRANKKLVRVECSENKPTEIADIILSHHENRTRTIVVVNTVKRAVNVYDAMKRKKPVADIVLIHSRFRPADKQSALDKLLADPGDTGTICISTQVIEAGVDVSSQTLVTDIAPWPSLVQRFGRCNRYGEMNDARIVLLETGISKKDVIGPYFQEELEHAVSVLASIENLAPSNLPSINTEMEMRQVIRKKDCLDLFDTSPDLSGLDVDISRYIRETDDHDVQAFWRNIPANLSPERQNRPSREELCSVPIGDFRSKKTLDAWSWDHLEKQWRMADKFAPGMTFMLRACDGGYSSETGWTGNKNDIPSVLSQGDLPEESNDDDFTSVTKWQTLSEHTGQVARELENIIDITLAEQRFRDALSTAAIWHDVGKAHPIFQNAMLGDPPKVDTGKVWAKSEGHAVAYERKGFRHELVSALMMLVHGMDDLPIYLAAAHHGKVRLSIRSLPHEKPPPDPTIRFARGVWDGDTIIGSKLGGDITFNDTKIDLSCMEFGDGPMGPSWMSRMLALRDDPSIGPFRLAYMEALLRIADWRASQ